MEQLPFLIGVLSALKITDVVQCLSEATMMIGLENGIRESVLKWNQVKCGLKRKFNMNEFNFKSQICTTREQSERLLSLGLKNETADMWRGFLVGGETLVPTEEVDLYNFYVEPTPAWSLGRLLALVNGEDWRAEITLKDERYGIHYGYESYWYDNIFDAVIAWIEDDIKEEYFNKEYLV